VAGKRKGRQKKRKNVRWCGGSHQGASTLVRVIVLSTLLLAAIVEEYKQTANHLLLFE